MPSLAHQHIAHALNRADEIEAENLRMEELERAASPLMYAVAGVFLALMLGAITEDFMVMYHAKEDARVTSAAMSDCANGKVISFGEGSVLTCQVRDLLK